jgi:hypothetical protein
MKKLIFFLSLCLVMSGSLKAQDKYHRSRPSLVAKGRKYPNYITDDTLTRDKKFWRQWCNIHNYIGTDSVKISKKDWTMMDSLSKINPTDSLTAYFAFKSSKDSVSGKMNTAIVFSETDNDSIRADTTRWAVWAKAHISQKNGMRPWGFVISHRDLRSIYSLDSCNNPPIAYYAYFIFHSKQDKKLSRIAMVIRPIFSGTPQPEVPNSQIGSEKDQKGATGSSYINIDFTNPCPPCSIHNQ